MGVKGNTRTLLSSWHNIPVRLCNVAAINLPFREVMIIDTLPFCRADIAEKLDEDGLTVLFKNIILIFQFACFEHFV